MLSPRCTNDSFSCTPCTIMWSIFGALALVALAVALAKPAARHLRRWYENRQEAAATRRQEADRDAALRRSEKSPYRGPGVEASSWTMPALPKKLDLEFMALLAIVLAIIALNVR